MTGPAPTVAGDPGALTGLAADFTAYASVLRQAGDGLRTIDTTDGWDGDAADAFRSAFDGEPARWLAAADAFTSASAAIDRYTAVLNWAKGQAAAIPVDDPQATEFVDRVRAQLSGAAADAALTIEAAAAAAPDGPGFLRRVDDAADAAGEQLAAFGADLGNAAASLGNAAVNNPSTAAALAGGGLLVAASALGEVGGVALDATGVGLPVGLGLNGVSTVGILTGVGIAGVAGASLIANALGPDRVQVFHADSGADAGADAAPPAPPFPPPTEITGVRKHAEERINGSRGDGGVPDEAMEDAVRNPVKEPEYVADDYGGTYQYVGRNATVALNERGQVTTAWPKGDEGRRIPR